RPLPPGDWHRWWLAMAIFALVLGPVFPPAYESHELFDGLFIGFAAFFGCGQLRFTENAGIRIAAAPGYDCPPASGKQSDPHEGAVVVVERDIAALDQILADVVTVEIEVHRGLQLAGVGAAAGEFALPPAGHEVLIDGEKLPPGAADALRIGFQIRAARDQVQVRHVGTVAV